MRVLRRTLCAAIAALTLAGTSPAVARADDMQRPHGHLCPAAHRTAVNTTAPPVGLEQYYHHDWRLGPIHLPHTGIVGRMLRGYRPQDSTSPFWFLGCYWQTSQQTNLSGWWYPDHNGFVLHDGRPVERPVSLRQGQLVDLFGSGRGNFVAPAGTPYTERALPPTNLDEYTPTGAAFNYHLYRVIKPFTVEAGPARPWFGQRGLGTQYFTSTPIPALITSGNLREIAPGARAS